MKIYLFPLNSITFLERVKKSLVVVFFCFFVFFNIEKLVENP